MKFFFLLKISNFGANTFVHNCKKYYIYLEPNLNLKRNVDKHENPLSACKYEEREMSSDFLTKSTVIYGNFTLKVEQSLQKSLNNELSPKAHCLLPVM